MKLLFIAPLFYKYEKEIYRALVPRYEKVVFRSVSPYGFSLCYNAIRVISGWLARKINDRYARDLCRLVSKEKFDRIFIIRGDLQSAEWFRTIKEQNPGIEIVHYQWDSLQNNPNGLVISRYADRNYSFDLGDVKKHPQFAHVPLFYSWGNMPTDALNAKIDTDVFFLGSYYFRRHEIVKRFKTLCEKQGLMFASYIYLPRLVYWRKKISGEKLKRNDVHFRPISRKDYYEAIKKAKIVLDIHSPTQTGATIRTVETLSLGRKLVSTNFMLKNESFYSPENICLWDTEDELNLKQLISTKFDHSKDSHVLSLNDWLDRIGV